MKRNLFVVALFFSLAVSPIVKGEIVYQTDFSTDPGWTTDQPGNCYWDSTNQNYHIRGVNEWPGYTPSRYAYHQLSHALDSFELTWVCNPSQVDWSAGLLFGLHDSSLMASGCGVTGINQGIEGGLVRSDPGLHWHMYYAGANITTAISDSADLCMPVLDGRSYTLTITYSGVSHLASFSVIDNTDPGEYYSTTVNVLGGFTNDLLYLGTSRTGTGEGGNYAGLSQYSVAEGSIDNVVLTPEPMTLTLLLLGGMAAVRWKRQ